MSGDEGSLGDIRRALVGITRRLDALADAVGVAAASEPSGALLDEATRARLAGIENLLAIGRGAAPAEARFLGIDRALTQTRADCAAIVEVTGERALAVLAQRGFRLPLEPRWNEGILGRAIDAGEVVQAGPRLGGPDALLDTHGLGAALAVPIPGPGGGAPAAGALLVARRRPVSFDPDAVGTLVIVADRLRGAVGARADRPAEAAPPVVPVTLFTSLDPAATAIAVASAAATQLGAEVVAVLLPDGPGFTMAGAVGTSADPGGPILIPLLATIAATGRPWVPPPDEPAELALAARLGATVRAVLPLSVDERLTALLAVGGTGPCHTALPEPLAHAAALALRNARLHAEALRAFTDTPPSKRGAPAAGPAALGDMASLLAVVLGRLASVGDRIADADAARDLAEAEEAAWQVAEAVRRVLGFAPGPGPGPAVPLDLVELVRDAVRSTEALWAAEGNGPPIFLDVAPVPAVPVHPPELRQALHHLLQNAREASRGADPIAVQLRPSGAAHVELAVVDRGCGMAPGTRARAGEPFFTTKGPGRLGVGLAMAQVMAARHHGTLEIETAPGRGTTVRLRLPASAAPVTGPAGRVPATPARRRLLVVDDERTVRDMLAQSLNRDGYVVHATGDVGEAIALLGREPIDVVVTDLVLPGGSGLEIARSVKRTHPGTPVILVTGWPGRVSPETLESHGIDAIVEKPVGLDTLRDTVAKLIERAAARPR